MNSICLSVHLSVCRDMLLCVYVICVYTESYSVFSQDEECDINFRLHLQGHLRRFRYVTTYWKKMFCCVFYWYYTVINIFKFVYFTDVYYKILAFQSGLNLMYRSYRDTTVLLMKNNRWKWIVRSLASNLENVRKISSAFPFTDRNCWTVNFNC